MNVILIQGSDLIVLAVLVLWAGSWTVRQFPRLRDYSIPVGVVGGLMCSLALSIVSAVGGPTVTFDMEIRDMLLLVFFTTIGLSAKASQLKAGGKALGLMVLCAGGFLIVQNVVGVLLALVMGVHPGYGLFAGSVSLSGGHGTAIAWGKEAVAAGLADAELTGVAFATFGLIAGGVLGGPLAEQLIKRRKLQPESSEPVDDDAPGRERPRPITMRRVLGVLLVLAVCLSLGRIVNGWLSPINLRLPGFLTAMLAAIVLTNVADYRGRPLRAADYQKVGEISLQLFLVISLMSMNLSSLGMGYARVFTAVAVQAVVIALFAVYVVFRVLGKNYDAAVVAGGFVGLGLGATPVAMANMTSIAEKYGPAVRAFVVVPLVGAFFIDLINAVVIKVFLHLPFMGLEAMQ